MNEHIKTGEEIFDAITKLIHKDESEILAKQQWASLSWLKEKIEKGTLPDGHMETFEMTYNNALKWVLSLLEEKPLTTETKIMHLKKGDIRITKNKNKIIIDDTEEKNYE